jgi:hypothetical protein
MTDLHNRLAAIAGPGAAPTTADVDADLARGRRALRRRRTLQATGGSAFAVAALVAAVSWATTGGAPTGPGGPQAADRPAATAAAVQLVAYKGEQPKGFTIDKVPDGWFVQDDDNYNLTLAPDRVQNPGPDVDPSRDPVHDPQSFVGKIGIMLSSKDQSGPGDGTAVKVGGKDGVLVKSPVGQTPDGPLPTPADGDTGWTLWVEQPSGAYLLIQFWEGLGMSREQMTELGAGVHVHKDAQQGVG